MLLAAIALVPAVVLLSAHRWAAGQQDDGDAAPPVDPTAPAPVATDALSTGVLAFRRAPTVISRDLNLDAFRSEVVPFFGQLNDRSCAAVAVDGELVAAYNEGVAVLPASNQKLLVAAVADEILGPDHRYRTTAEAVSAPVEGTLDGDLYLVGGGDPLLSSRWYPESNLERYPVTTPTWLDTLADDVVAAGVQRVTGGVVGDGTRYDDEFYAPGWGVGDAGLEGGPYDALLVNDARVLGDDERSSDPNEAAAREFSRLLVERGVEIAGGSSSGAAPDGTVEIAAVESAPLSAVVAEMLVNSDNNTAELVVKELGHAESGTGTREAGLEVMRRQLGDWGVDTSTIVLADGSGLSLDNRVTCEAVLTVLQASGVDSAVGTGLPIAATSGTLSDVFVDHSLAGILTGKTGTLDNAPFNVDPPAVKALAGYVPVEGGGAVEYVLILNGPTISDQSEYRPAWGSLADVLATYPAGPSPAELGPR
jgi:D-alanyl-D-alanine carboxypeptidase/D-alanyl-D-alanine-endopeptidase (penicillin-binding protein 4)